MEYKKLNLFNVNNELEKINYTSIRELKNKFVNIFNKIFIYENQEIKIIGIVIELYFRAKDILKILNNNTKMKTINNLILKLDNKFKKSLKEIIDEINNRWITDCVPNKNLKNISYHEGKEIYLNEAGLYYFIINSEKEEAKNFIMFDLLPSIRKNIYNELFDEVDKRDKKIDMFIKQNNQILNNFKQLEEINKKLENQNINFKKINKKQYINLNEDLDSVNLKINSYKSNTEENIILKKNLSSIKKNLKYYFILIKIIENNKYFFLYGQKKNIIKKLKKISKYEKIIDFYNFSNPMNFINTLKKKSIEIDFELKKKIIKKLNNNYSNLSKSKYEMKYNLLYKKNKLFKIKSNELILNNSIFEDILKIFNDLIKEQKNIEEDMFDSD